MGSTNTALECVPLSLLSYHDAHAAGHVGYFKPEYATSHPLFLTKTSSLICGPIESQFQAKFLSPGGWDKVAGELSG